MRRTTASRIHVRAPFAVLAAAAIALLSSVPVWAAGRQAARDSRHRYPCSSPSARHVPCYFSTPSGDVRCEWTPASGSVACELLATGRGYRLGPTGKAKAVKLRLTRRGETLPPHAFGTSSPFAIVFPQKLSCEDTATTITCNQDEGFGFFKLGPKLARSAFLPQPAASDRQARPAPPAQRCNDLGAIRKAAGAARSLVVDAQRSSRANARIKGVNVPDQPPQPASAQGRGAASGGAGVVTKASPRSVADTVARLTALVAARGMKLFVVIDHSGEAQGVGLELRDTKLVVFGSPQAGTPLMAAAPLAALDLPLKVLVWADGGQTKVSYTAPSALTARYGLSDEMAGRLAGIDALTDAVVEN